MRQPLVSLSEHCQRRNVDIMWPRWRWYRLEYDIAPQEVNEELLVW